MNEKSINKEIIKLHSHRWCEIRTSCTVDRYKYSPVYVIKVNFNPNDNKNIHSSLTGIKSSQIEKKIVFSLLTRTEPLIIPVLASVASKSR